MISFSHHSWKGLCAFRIHGLGRRLTWAITRLREIHKKSLDMAVVAVSRCPSWEPPIRERSHFLDCFLTQCLCVCFFRLSNRFLPAWKKRACCFPAEDCLFGWPGSGPHLRLGCCVWFCLCESGFLRPSTRSGILQNGGTKRKRERKSGENREGLRTEGWTPDESKERQPLARLSPMGVIRAARLPPFHCLRKCHFHQVFFFLCLKEGSFSINFLFQVSYVLCCCRTRS